MALQSLAGDFLSPWRRPVEIRNFMSQLSMGQDLEKLSVPATWRQMEERDSISSIYFDLM